MLVKTGACHDVYPFIRRPLVLGKSIRCRKLVDIIIACGFYLFDEKACSQGGTLCGADGGIILQFCPVK